jgi:hypothetical protein
MSTNARGAHGGTRGMYPASLRADQAIDRRKPSSTLRVVRSRPHRQLPCHLSLCGSPTEQRLGDRPILGTSSGMSWVVQSAVSEIHFVLRSAGSGTTRSHVEDRRVVCRRLSKTGKMPSHAGERPAAGKWSILPRLSVRGNRNTDGQAAGINKFEEFFEKSDLQVRSAGG